MADPPAGGLLSSSIKMFFVYAIYNPLRKKIYIGHTEDLAKRIERHNGLLKNKAKSFTSKNSGSWNVVHVEPFHSRSEAMLREKKLKSARGRRFIWTIIEEKLPP